MTIVLFMLFLFYIPVPVLPVSVTNTTLQLMSNMFLPDAAAADGLMSSDNIKAEACP